MDFTIQIAICSLFIGYNLDNLIRIFLQKTLNDIKSSPKKSKSFDYTLPESSNNAIEKFFNKVVDSFIVSWYKFSESRDFILEIKYCLYRILINLYKRFRLCNIGSLVTQKLIPLSLRHVEHTSEIMKATNSLSIDDNRLIKLCPHLHFAMLSREIEYRYLKNISRRLLKVLLNFNPCSPIVSYMERGSKQTMPPKHTHDKDKSDSNYYGIIQRTYSLNLHSKITNIHNTFKFGNQYTHFHAIDCVIALLSEILASTILLPLMDTISQPDLINKIIINCLSKSNSSVPSRPQRQNNVQLLREFESSWKLNVIRKPAKDPVEKYISESSANNHEFLQFMKRINYLNLYMFSLILNKIKKIFKRGVIFNADLTLIISSLKDLENLVVINRDVCSGEITSVYIEGDEPFFVTLRFYQLIHSADCISNKDRQSIHELQDTCEYTYNNIKQFMNSFIMSFYYESSEYLSSFFGILKHQGFPLPKANIKSKSQDTNLSDEEYLRRDDQLVCKTLENFKSYRSITNTMTEIDLSRLSTSIHKITQSFVELNKGVASNLPMASLALGNSDGQSVIQPAKYFAFVIQTFTKNEATGDLSSFATVNRKYGEFYVLEQKLQEFHGSNIKKCLPPKKSFQTKNIEFLDTQMPYFDQYLKYLIKEPILKGSELVYSFLTSDNQFTSNLPIDIGIGKLVKSVPMRLSKERGQNLDTFLLYFCKSCEDSERKAVKVQFNLAETDDCDPLGAIVNKSVQKKSLFKDSLQNRLHSVLFFNNASLTLDQAEFRNFNEKCEKTVTAVSNTTEFLQMILTRIRTNFQANVSFVIGLIRGLIISTLMYIISYVDDLLDKIIEVFINGKVRGACKKNGIEYFFNLMSDTVFQQNAANKTDKDRMARQVLAKSLLKDNIKALEKYDYLKIIPERFGDNVDEVYEIFQDPKLNKQLAYELLEEFMHELFPEMAEKKSTEKVTAQEPRDVSFVKTTLDPQDVTERPEQVAEANQEPKKTKKNYKLPDISVF